MGSRLDKNPLNRVQFDILPDRLKTVENIPSLQEIYDACYFSVFNLLAPDNAGRFTNSIQANAREADCSIRIFILCNMAAHCVQQQEILQRTDKLNPTVFTAGMLTSNLAIKRAKTYQKICCNQFGGCNSKSLAMLVKNKTRFFELESVMLRSEITAARWLIDYRIHHGKSGEKEF